jgi:hypothetical protein
MMKTKGIRHPPQPLFLWGPKKPHPLLGGGIPGPPIIPGPLIPPGPLPVPWPILPGPPPGPPILPFIGIHATSFYHFKPNGSYPLHRIVSSIEYNMRRIKGKRSKIKEYNLQSLYEWIDIFLEYALDHCVVSDNSP